MAIINYGGYALIPAGTVEIVDQPILTGNQGRLGTTYRLVITGKLITYKGSPQAGSLTGGNWGGYRNQFWTGPGYPPDETNPTFSYHQLNMMQNKQAALQSLFSQDGLWLEFTSPDGSTPFRCQPKNAVVTFAPGIWFTECDYTITLETDVVYLNGEILQGLPFSDLIQDANENWQLELGEVVKTFSVSHTVSAVGKKSFDSVGNQTQPAWQNARDFINGQLILGWNGMSAFSNVPGADIFQESSLASGVLNLGLYSPYNFSRTQTVDELGGSYSVTESWVLAAQASGTNIYTVGVHRIVEDSYTTVIANIQGTIRGFYDGLFNYDQRMQAAEYVWSQLNGPTGLLPTITSTIAAPTGLLFNMQPTQGSIDYNVQDGTLTYNYEFSNKLFEGDAFEQYVVSSKNTISDYLTSYSINGTVKGRRYDGDVDQLASFHRAQVWWNHLDSGNAIYDRVVSSYYFPEATGTVEGGLLAIQPTPLNKNVDMNEGDGVITYSYEYNNRRNDFGYNSNDVREDYQISKHFSLEEGMVTFTINGTVEGLNVTNIYPRESKYALAAAYFSGFVLPNLTTRITGYYLQPLINYQPQSQEIQLNPPQGTITYSFEYKDIPPPILSGVLSEHITVSQENFHGTVQTVGKIGIVGRLAGVLYQQMNTTPEKVRTLSIETVIPPTGGADISACIALMPNYDSFISGAQPINSFLESNSTTFDWRFGHFSQQVRWVF